MKLYIHTVPKAGTYLLATFMENMGFENTGYHILQDDYLDTKKFSLEENAKTPTITSVKKYFVNTLREMSDNQMAFGHTPAPLLSWALPRYRFICSYRHPKKTLLSEFIDFRFRRIDVDFVSPKTISNDEEAFVQYLKLRGPFHMGDFSDMLAAATLFHNDIFSRYPSDRAIFINFDDFLHSSKPAFRIARHYGLNLSLVDKAWKDALATETKTNATSLKIDREKFWTAKALEAAKHLNIESYVEAAKVAGLNL